jgi:hypothetical protein
MIRSMEVPDVAPDRHVRRACAHRRHRCGWADHRPTAAAGAGGAQGGLTPFRNSSLGKGALEGFALNQMWK